MSSLGGGGGGWWSRATHARDFDCDVYPRVGILIGHHAFDLSISNSIRGVNYLFMLIWTTIFYQGVETLMSFLENVKIPTLFPDPPPSPLRFDIDRCVISFLEALWVFLFLNLECHFVESFKMWWLKYLFNANSGLKVNRTFIFLALKCSFTAYSLCILSLFKLKTKQKNISFYFSIYKKKTSLKRCKTQKNQNNC